MKGNNSYLLKTPLWYKPNLAIGQSSVFYKPWYNKEIRVVNDLIKDFSPLHFYSFQEFSEHYGITSNFLTFQGIINTVRTNIALDNIGDTRIQHPFIPLNIVVFMKSKKGTKDMYEILVKNNIIPTGKKQ